jgi:hypothetical protein
MRFEYHIGIDYSGRGTPMSRTSGLQVYATFGNEEPRPIPAPNTPPRAQRNWCRKEIAEWLIDQVRSKRIIAGIDHGFSFPIAYLQRYDLKTWQGFLDDFCQHWPTDHDDIRVDSIRGRNPARTGSSNELRLTEKWTSSAKSVFLFDVQGSVAKSTHAGIPWLRRIRQAVGTQVHFWPFDGWDVPEGRSAIVEVYPSLARKRCPKGDRTDDQHDAFAIACWLAEIDRNGFLDRYFDPPLTGEQRQIADLEGWIFGVS